ncbi:hypothetical protein RHCH11_RHCH11_01457 [Beijerinckiaceae bacterium RH CH11]|nr:hypothetical protein RHCH11_RHCH11_01457 [Beijerinckiaceae bacterium RH CH11]VVB44978.1 hypothetical protein RHAL8_01454 [Beijerinckiaceae bacterium RH AL8]
MAARAPSRTFALLTLATMTVSGADAARAQAIDCGQLRAQIAQIDRGGGRAGGGARRAQAELARTQAQVQQLGCGAGLASFFGGGDPRCSALQQRAQQLQAAVQSGGGGGGGGLRADLVARFNAYCRGGQPQQAQQPQQRGFFESLFGGAQDEPRPQAPLPDVPQDPNAAGGDGDGRAHGGGQAVCVRTCDGGFFPLGVSSHRDGDDLKQMCSALCPGTETAVYTRSPNAEINSAASLDGKSYMDMPNALKFQKTVVPDCSCKPKDKTWAEALANAEEVIGNTRKGDIVVTQAKSDEMSRPKMDAKTRSSMLAGPAPATVAPEDAAKIAGDAADNDAASPPETAATDGTGAARPAVRRVGPQP